MSNNNRSIQNKRLLSRSIEEQLLILNFFCGSFGLPDKVQAQINTGTIQSLVVILTKNYEFKKRQTFVANCYIIMMNSFYYNFLK